MGHDWVVMVFVDRWDLTERAAADALAQGGVKPRLLLIDNGSGEAARILADVFVDAASGSALIWHHRPPLPSLAATWNLALDRLWETGAERVLVCNNDVRLHSATYHLLAAAMKATGGWFVSGVGVTAEQFSEAWGTQGMWSAEMEAAGHESKGGPDFSCFLISRECHEKYRFDEAFTPAYCEDLDFHRRMMLGGDGRRIFSVNVPFLHVDQGSGTLKGMDPERRARTEELIGKGSRAYYERKWGGPVNQEKYLAPFGVDPLQQLSPWPGPPPAITTPELQRWVWQDR